MEGCTYNRDGTCLTSPLIFGYDGQNFEIAASSRQMMVVGDAPGKLKQDCDELLLEILEGSPSTEENVARKEELKARLNPSEKGLPQVFNAA